jgi:transcriptional regulator with XRE-family HTH domain
MLRKVDNSMFVAFDKIKELADKQGISINVLEEKLGYGTNTLYRLKRSNPSSKVLREIADYFGVSTDYLLGRTDNPKIATDNKLSEVDLKELAKESFFYDGHHLNNEDIDLISSLLETRIKNRQD